MNKIARIFIATAMFSEEMDRLMAEQQAKESAHHAPQHSNGAEPQAEICPFAGSEQCTEGKQCSGEKGCCDKW